MHNKISRRTLPKQTPPKETTDSYYFLSFDYFIQGDFNKFMSSIFCYQGGLFDYLAVAKSKIKEEHPDINLERVSIRVVACNKIHL